MFILKAPAGCGKTCFLKSTYYDIVYNNKLNFQIPIFLKLKNYQRGQLANIVNNSYPFNHELYDYSNYFLLIDGYDEIPKVERKDLINDLYSLLNVNQSYNRKVIITVRTFEYDSDDFAVFTNSEKQFLRLSKLVFDDIKKLIKTFNISSCNDDLINKLWSNYNQGNIFYFSNCLAYYDEHKSEPNSRLELYDWIIEKEMHQLFKGKPYDLDLVCRLAFHMTLNNKNNLSNLSSLNIGMEKDYIEFSHKVIQEYLAAKCLAKLDFNKIISLTTYDGVIFTSVRNTVGLLLNILSTDSSNLQLYNELFNEYKKKEINYNSLSQVDPENLVDNLEFYEESLDYYINNSISFDIVSDNFVNHFRIEQRKKENILYQKIVSSKNQFESYSVLMILFELSLKPANYFSTAFRTQLVDLFYNKYCNNQGPKYLDLSTLIYCINRYIDQTKELSSEKLHHIIKKVCVDNDFENFDQVCLLALNNKNISKEDFNGLYNVFFVMLQNDNNSGGSWVPQDLDDNFKTPISYNHPTSNFLLLLNYFLDNKPLLIWQLLSDIVKEDLFKKFNYYSSYKPNYLDCLSKKIAENSIDKLSEKQIEILVKFIKYESNIKIGYRRKCFLKSLLSNMSYKEVMELYKKIYETKTDTEDDKYFADYKIWGLLEKRNEYINAFIEAFKDEGDYFNRVARGYFASSGLKQYIDGDNQKYMEAIFEEAKKRDDEVIAQEEEKTKSENTSFHIAFSIDALLSEGKAVFSKYDNNQITSKDILLLNRESYHYNFEHNYFVFDIIRDLKLKKDVLNFSNYQDYINNSFESEKLIYLVEYFRNYPGAVKEITQQEKVKILNLIQKQTINEDLFNILLSLSKSNVFKDDIIEFIKANISDYDCFMGYFFDNYYPQTKWCILESWFNKTTIISYLLEAFETSNSFIFCIEHYLDYINENNQILKKPCFISKIINLKTKFKNYIISDKYIDKNNLRKSMTFARTLGLSIKDFAFDWLVNEIKYISNESHEFFDIEDYLENEENVDYVTYVLKALYSNFKNEENIDKKRSFAEFYLQLNHHNSEVFGWFVEYLTKTQNSKISARRYSSKEEIYVTNVESLKDLATLYFYCDKLGVTAKRDFIRKIVVKSYKEIALLGNDETYKKVDEAISELSITLPNDIYLPDLKNKLLPIYVDSKKGNVSFDSL